MLPDYTSHNEMIRQGGEGPSSTFTGKVVTWISFQLPVSKSTDGFDKCFFQIYDTFTSIFKRDFEYGREGTLFHFMHS